MKTDFNEKARVLKAWEDRLEGMGVAQETVSVFFRTGATPDMYMPALEAALKKHGGRVVAGSEDFRLNICRVDVTANAAGLAEISFLPLLDFISPKSEQQTVVYNTKTALKF